MCLCFSSSFFVGGFMFGAEIISNADYQIVVRNPAKANMTISYYDERLQQRFTIKKRDVHLEWQLDNRGSRSMYGKSCSSFHDNVKYNF